MRLPIFEIIISWLRRYCQKRVYIALEMGNFIEGVFTSEAAAEKYKLEQGGHGWFISIEKHKVKE